MVVMVNTKRHLRNESHRANKRLLVWIVSLIGASTTLLMESAMADGPETYEAEFTKDGKLIRPAGWREWVFVGSPLTPNTLNGGAAPFPEFHTVYIDPASWAHYKKTGTFREGAMFAKELTLVGDTAATSGIGFFNGKQQGFEIAHKDSKRYPSETGGWAYYTFGHRDEPYENTAAAMPTAACAACHTAAAAEDMVFTQYYPILKGAKGAGDAGAGIGGKRAGK